MSNEILVVFHNGSIIKELENEFEGDFECLRENTEKYINFSVPIEKEITDDKDDSDKDDSESTVPISYKIKFTDSARFVTASLSNLVDNLTERIHKIKCKDCDCASSNKDFQT